MSDLELVGVTKRYGGATALDGVNLRVADGEFFTLVGPSGCGKTTTLRAIAGFEQSDAGSVRFGGREMSGVAPEDRDGPERSRFSAPRGSHEGEELAVRHVEAHVPEGGHVAEGLRDAVEVEVGHFSSLLSSLFALLT